MSDNSKLIGTGGAHINSAQNLNLQNKLPIDSLRFKNTEDMERISKNSIMSRGC